LAATSRHPFSKALSARYAGLAATDATEVPGMGVEAKDNGHVWRLGRAAFCSAETQKLDAEGSIVWLSRNGEPVAAFSFTDQVRPEAPAVINTLKARGFAVSLLSGDRAGPVKALARNTGIADARAGLTPEDKLETLTTFTTEGEKVVMVGDGLNDAPALMAAHVSMAPSSAADIGRNAADFIYTRDSLEAVPFALDLARRAARAVKQNFGLAIAYNCVAVPLAVSGHVTPLVAALAMSSSSVLVTLNALRLRFGGAPLPVPTQPSAPETARPVPAE